MEQTLLEYYDRHKENEFVRWKVIRAFQSFNSIEIKNILKNVICTDPNKVIAEEAKRSLCRIEDRRQSPPP
jgi:hypothetical protein